MSPPADRHAALDAGVEADLRRRRRRDHTARLVERAVWLPPRDRALIEAVFHHGRTVTDLAKLTGDSPRSLRRHVRQLAARLVSPRFLFVVHHRDLWTASRRRVGTACFIEGLSLRAAAGQLGMSLHTVRRHTDAIEAAYETVLAAARTGRPRTTAGPDPRRPTEHRAATPAPPLLPTTAAPIPPTTAPRARSARNGANP